LAALIARAGEPDLESFHSRAVRDPEWYWREVVEDLGLVFAVPFERVCHEPHGPEFPRWFTGGRMNASASCLDRWQGNAARTALIAENEAGDVRSVSYRELFDQVVGLAGYLRRAGVRPGDPVGLFLPLVPEAAVALLACARVGAVAVPAYSGYGPGAVAARLRACSAPVLITADGFMRKGNAVRMKEVVDRALEEAPSVRLVVVLDHLGLGASMRPHRDVAWREALELGSAAEADGGCELLDPNAPLLIVFTSGTTGAPKGIVLSHGGFLAKAAHDFAYLFDVQDDDVVLWPSDLGWLMAPIIIVGTLALNATAVMLEGVPGHPTAERYWDMVERHRVTLLGTSPSATRLLARAGNECLAGRELESLRAFASVGEPWDRTSWDWLFETVGRRRHPILNYCGGTEISGGIVGCYTIQPIAPCGFSGPVVGLSADVVDEFAEPVRGRSGELVLRRLTPGVTHSFWQDDEHYLNTYWRRLPGLWIQGDEALIDEHGYWHVIGRSDDTIKVAGKRIGPAEVEAAVKAHPEVVDAAVIGVPDDAKGSAICCFVVLTRQAPKDALVAEIRGVVTERLGKTMVPAEIHVVRGLPRTRNGKLVRRSLRSRYLGLDDGDTSTLEDVALLDAIPVRVRV
jgi:acetyl-CoA synthetase